MIYTHNCIFIHRANPQPGHTEPSERRKKRVLVMYLDMLYPLQMDIYVSGY